jgi:hypothetical protein
MNDNGHLLLNLCARFNLAITNTMFRLPTKHKTTWMHPRSKHWHLIDYAIVRQKDVSQVQITRVMRGAYCWTDHRLVVTKLRLRLRRLCRSVRTKPPSLNFDALKHLGTRLKYTEALATALPHTDTEIGDVEADWGALSSHI